MIRLHPHARVRLAERGVTAEEVAGTIRDGDPFVAKLGRAGFRHNFVYNGNWLGRFYATKQVEVIAVREGRDWLVITVIARFF